MCEVLFNWLLCNINLMANLKETTSSKNKKLKISFWLRYKTNYGENIFITFLNNDYKLTQPIAMHYYDEVFWTTDLFLSINELNDENIYYQYHVINEDGIIKQEAFADKYFNLHIGKREINIIDYWNGTELAENIFFTKPFLQTLIPKTTIKTYSPKGKNYKHIFKVKAPLLHPNKTICLLGNVKELNNWNTQKPILLTKKEKEFYYSTFIKLPTNCNNIEYKYGVFDIEKKQFVHYEDGDNRVLNKQLCFDDLTIVHDGFVQLPFNSWKGAGVNIPVFSLRSENSFGIGEFYDLKLLAKWAAKVSLKLIQILPVNDTTENFSDSDSYPYAAISAFALHPIYICLDELIDKSDKVIVNNFNSLKKKLNQSSQVSYSMVLKHKWHYLQQIFTKKHTLVFATKEYQTFYQKNKFWLIPYAAFCFLRNKYGTANFALWKEFAIYNEKKIALLVSEKGKHFKEVSIHFFVQFYLHKQLSEAVQEANKLGIILKGDIPIGINKNSVDCWQYPQLFNCNMQAGAPPDDFTEKGQNWGFPTYNWQVMQEDNFLWWKLRFQQMQCYYDAFRIDHILGFFRIWSIPSNAVEGVMGYFVPAIPLQLNDFNKSGIFFNYVRYTQPFITDEILESFFDEYKEEVINQFLIKDDFSDNYTLTEKFSTQILVENFFSALPNNTKNNKIKQGLFNLISNVILLDIDGNENEFHFRFNMFKTTSFKQLSPIVQQQLLKLYNNYFFEQQNELWKKEGIYKLTTIKCATNMLVCGEDLGLVPAIVPEVMKSLGILSLEIQRMPKQNQQHFLQLNQLPYLSVAMPSTHDMSTIRSWWQEDFTNTKLFYNTVLNKTNHLPQECTVDISKEIIKQHLYSSAMWSIFLLQDLFGIDENLRIENHQQERINNPANKNQIWNYRMHISLEKLLRQFTFNAELKKQIQLSGR